MAAMAALFNIAFRKDLLVSKEKTEALDVEVELDARTSSALATFKLEGRICGSMSMWLEDDLIEGFILRGTSYDIEVVVRDLSALNEEPDLRELVDRVCRAGNLKRF